MTREDAITNLEMIRLAYIEPVTELQRKIIDDTFDMAIKALVQEPCIQEKQANADKIDAVYIDGFKAGYSQARFDLEQQPCEDCISRSSIKQKLQKHRDFFTKAYSGYSYLPQNDKSRVDEITNCISMVVNEPPVTTQPKTVLYSGDGYADGYIVYDMAECPNCGYKYEDGDKDWRLPFCPNCGQSLDWESEDIE